jgi:5-methylcytosine-specific restriction enzyme A
VMRISNLQALAIAAHRQKTIADLKAIAKMKRIRLKHAGLWVTKHPLPGGKHSQWKRRLDGRIVKREEWWEVNANRRGR